jgi:hypothetical protein
MLMNFTEQPYLTKKFLYLTKKFREFYGAGIFNAAEV